MKIYAVYNSTDNSMKVCRSAYAVAGMIGKSRTTVCRLLQGGDCSYKTWRIWIRHIGKMDSKVRPGSAVNLKKGLKFGSGDY